MSNYALYTAKLDEVRKTNIFQNVERFVQLLDADLPTQQAFEELPHQVQKDMVRLVGVLGRLNAGEIDFDTAAEQIMDRCEKIVGNVESKMLVNTLEGYVGLFDTDAPTPIASITTDNDGGFEGTIAHQSLPLSQHWADAGTRVIYNNPSAYGTQGPYEGVVVDGKMDLSGTIEIDFAHQGPYGKGSYGVNVMHLSLAAV